MNKEKREWIKKENRAIDEIREIPNHSICYDMNVKKQCLFINGDFFKSFDSAQEALEFVTKSREKCITEELG